jgi:hypothetical protein
MHRLASLILTILLCFGIASCQDNGGNQTGGTPERPGPAEPSRGPSGPASPGNP